VSPLATRATIDVHEARIELSDAKRKDLQPLTEPADVVLVADGKPLNRAQDKKLQALRAARRSRDEREGRRARPDAADADADADADASAPAAVAPARRGVRVTVNAPRKLWVTGQDAYLELGLAPDFRVSVDDETRVFGQVTVRRGRIDVFGRRFDLKADSTLQFSGPPDKPELDVQRAVHQPDRERHRAVDRQGPLDHLSIAVSSPNRPDLTESQLYTLVITGHCSWAAAPAARRRRRRRRRRSWAVRWRRACKRPWRRSCRSTC